MSGLSFGNIPDQTYHGSPIELNLDLSVNGIGLQKDRDYTISYKNNNGPGTASFTITGKGNYTGSCSKTFKIVADGSAPPQQNSPTPEPTKPPTPVPTKTPTKVPTKAPTAAPTKAPTKAPSKAPTQAPTATPSPEPTYTPTPEATPVPELTEEPEPTDEPEPTGEPEPTEEPEPSPTPELTGEPGTSPTLEVTNPTGEPTPEIKEPTPTGTYEVHYYLTPSEDKDPESGESSKEDNTAENNTTEKGKSAGDYAVWLLALVPAALIAGVVVGTVKILRRR